MKINVGYSAYSDSLLCLMILMQIVMLVYTAGFFLMSARLYLIFHLLGIARFGSTFQINIRLKIDQMALWLCTALFTPLFLYSVGMVPNLNT